MDGTIYEREQNMNVNPFCGGTGGWTWPFSKGLSGPPRPEMAEQGKGCDLWFEVYSFVGTLCTQFFGAPPLGERDLGVWVHSCFEILPPRGA